jgi:cell pole-organizing protein PopZ
MTAAAGDPAEKDQSMDDILASIRRIMLDEQARLQDSPAPAAYATERLPARHEDPVLILDSSMVVEDHPAPELATSPAEQTVLMLPAEAVDAPPHPVHAESTPDARDAIVTETAPSVAAAAVVPPAQEPGSSAHTIVLGSTAPVAVTAEPVVQQPLLSPQAIEALMAPAAAAAAAASVEALLRQLSEERIAALQPAAPPSPTIEEVVRAELRPFLKAWLDEHLPAMVERLVRVEITRLIGRSGF